MARNLLRRVVVAAIVLALVASAVSPLPAVPATAAAPPAAAETIATGNYYGPAVLALRSGTALAMASGSGSVIASFRRPGGVWSTPVDPAASLRTGNYTVSVGKPVASDSSDAVLAAVRQVYGGKTGLWLITFHGKTGTWTTPELISDDVPLPSNGTAQTPLVAVSDSGTVEVVLAYLAGGKTTTIIGTQRAAQPGAWSPFRTVVSEANEYPAYVTVHALPHGRFVATWLQYITGADVDHYVNNVKAATLDQGASAWGAPVTLYDHTGSVSDYVVPHAASWGGADPGLLVATQITIHGVNVIQTDLFNPISGAWSAGPDITDGTATWGSAYWDVAADDLGPTIVRGAFADRDAAEAGSEAILASRYRPDTGTWDIDRVVVPAAPVRWDLAIGVGPDGSAVATWQVRDGGQESHQEYATRAAGSGGAWTVAAEHLTDDNVYTRGIALETWAEGAPIFVWANESNGIYARTGTFTPAATLDVSVAATVPSGGLPIGDTIDLDATVTAGSRPVNDVTVKLALPAGLQVVHPPKTTGFDLAANASRTISWTVKGTKAGKVTARASVAGTADNGAALSAAGTKPFEVSDPILALTAATDPATIRLPVTDKGKVRPKEVVVTVRIRNTGKVTIKSVVLERAWARPVDKTEPLDQLDFAKKTFPIKIGTLKAGATVAKKLPLEVTGDGRYKIDLLATYTRAGESEVERGTGGRFTVNVAPLWMTADMDGSSERGKQPWVKGGRAFYLSGQVKNLSAYKQLCLWPMLPKLTGNAGGAGPVDLSRFSSAAVLAPPLAGAIKPGGSVPFGMQVRTRSDGGVRAGVKLNPQASVLDADEDCDALAARGGGIGTPLSDKDITITEGSDRFQGSVDVSVPSPPPSDAVSEAENFFGGLTVGTIATIAESLRGTAIAAREAFDGYTKNPSLLLPTMEGIYAVGGLLSFYWESASPEERENVIFHVLSALENARGDAWHGLQSSVGAAAEGWMAKVQDAYATGNMNKLAYVIGYGGGSIGGQIVADMVMTELGIGLAKKIPALAKVFARVGGESVTFAAMRDMPAGKLLNRSEMRRLWGASLEDIRNFKRIAKEEGIVIGIRSRAPISVENLGRGATWKHENLKPKNVSPLDIEWLGFKKADNGLVAMKKYSKAEENAILRRIEKAKLSTAERAEVMKRAEVRFEEAEKYLDKIKGFSEDGKIDVGFNYSENGVDEPTAEIIRRFTLTGEREANGSHYFRPWQQKLSLPSGRLPKWCRNFGGSLGVLCRVTGDMDGVYLASTSGRPLPKAKLIRVYKKLAAVGWQHPETFTWVDQMTGKFFFKAKEKILRGLTRGGEKLMEFAPDGRVRATWIDLEKSRMYAPYDYFVARVGGFNGLAR